MLLQSSPKLITLYGSLAIHTYGLCIALGLLSAYYLLSHDKKINKIITLPELTNIFTGLILAGIIGGRLLFIFENYNTLSFITAFSLTTPGFSILGTVIAAVSFALWQQYFYHTFSFTLLDRIALYAPLVQSFGRVGCFFTGCCYGMQYAGLYSITYSHHDHLAPLYISFYPTQLYSAITLLFLFFLLYFLQNKNQQSGQLLSYYIIGCATERFMLDFLRADRRLIIGTLSATQLLALLLFLTGGILYYYAQYRKKSFPIH